MKATARKLLSNERGFTFVELLIVSAVILALLAFSTPLFRKSFADLELKEMVSNISKLIMFAQQRAVIDRCNYQLAFDPKAGTYRLFKIEGEVQNKKYVGISDRFGRLFKIPENIEMKGSSKEIIFYPDGHSDNGSGEQPAFEFMNKNEKIIRIDTTGMMGNVVVTEK
jgi:prepilin-type N-terminal cleavage/methylation domain-containing protein